MKPICLLLFFLNVVVFAQNGNETEIVILHVNDMHGKIDKFPYLSTMIKEIRAKHKYVFLLSAGDIFSGNPIVDKFHDQGFPMIDLMNMLPFSLSTLGNHEFDFGGTILAKRISELKHSVICANMLKYPDYFPKLKPYEILRAGKTSIAVLGLTQVSTNGYPDTHPDRVKEFAFEHGITTAEKYLPKLKKYPIRIVLSHMGYENDSILATKIPYITAIVGGHSHKKIQPMKMVNQVAILQSENYLKYLGVLTIKIKGNKVTYMYDTLLPITNAIKPDTVILRKVEYYNNNDEFKKIVGYATDTIWGIQSLGCMMTHAYRNITQADFAVQNSGGIRVTMIPQGSITVKQILELDPFANDLIVCKMNPEQLRQLIRYGYEKEGKPDIFSSGFISKLYLNSNSKIQYIELYDMENRLLDENKSYRVALGSYLYNAYKFDRTDEGVSVGKTTTDAIFEYLSLVKGISFKNCISSMSIIINN